MLNMALGSVLLAVRDKFGLETERVDMKEADRIWDIAQEGAKIGLEKARQEMQRDYKSILSLK